MERLILPAVVQLKTHIEPKLQNKKCVEKKWFSCYVQNRDKFSDQDHYYYYYYY